MEKDAALFMETSAHARQTLHATGATSAITQSTAGVLTGALQQEHAITTAGKVHAAQHVTLQTAGANHTKKLATIVITTATVIAHARANTAQAVIWASAARAR